jgi:hypothetical protein
MTQEGNCRFLELGDPKGRTSCRHSTRKPRLFARQLRLVRCFAQRRYRSNVRQFQALFCLLTRRKPALVIRAVQLVLRESIGAIGVRHGAARQASLASGRKIALHGRVPSDRSANPSSCTVPEAASIGGLFKWLKSSIGFCVTPLMSDCAHEVSRDMEWSRLNPLRRLQTFVPQHSSLHEGHRA